MSGHEPKSMRDLVRLSDAVWQWPVPTPTLPPAFVTNTYFVHFANEVLIVDFGGTDPALVEVCSRYLQTLGTTRVVGLVATHYHRDHTDGLPMLAQAYGAPIYVHAADFDAALESMHPGPSVRVLPMPASFLVGHAVTVQVVHKPGHTHGHVHLVLPDEGVILVGDHLAGDGSVWIGAPDGHMQTYYDALAHIASSGCRVAGPGHGVALQDAAKAATALLQRRLGREAQICATITNWQTQQDIFVEVYGDTVAPAASDVARRTLAAHLQRLVDVGQVERRYAGGRGYEYRVKNAIQSTQRADRL